MPDAGLLPEFAWRAVGPVNMGGRIDDVEAVESDPSVIYVGAATGGVWKTTNNGTTWAPVFDAQPNLSIGDIAIAPSIPRSSQQISDVVLAKTEHLFRPRPAIAWDEDKRTWHGGDDALFRAKNPPDAVVPYYLKSPAAAAVTVAIVDADGKTVKEIEGARRCRHSSRRVGSARRRQAANRAGKLHGEVDRERPHDDGAARGAHRSEPVISDVVTVALP